MRNSKVHQKGRLIYTFGLRMAPLEGLISGEHFPSESDYRTAVAKVQAGEAAWREQVKEFAALADDVFLSHEYQDISHVPERCCSTLKGILHVSDLVYDLPELKRKVEPVIALARSEFFEYVDRVPVDWEPVVFEANTPFTSYLRINESIEPARQRLHYFDRYLKPDFFKLFLDGLDEHVSIRLVTTAGDARYGVSGVSAVSRLAQMQFADYQLIEVDPSVLHDRNLRVDDHNFTLGPGVDRAGMALTNFGPADSSKDAHNELDQIIASGRVVT